MWVMRMPVSGESGGGRVHRCVRVYYLEEVGRDGQCFPGASREGRFYFRVIFRLVWEAEKVGWEVNYEFFLAHIHLV